MDTAPTGFLGLGLSEITSFFSSTFGVSPTDLLPNKSSSSSLNRLGFGAAAATAAVVLGFDWLTGRLSGVSGDGAVCGMAADNGETGKFFCGD